MSKCRFDVIITRLLRFVFVYRDAIKHVCQEGITAVPIQNNKPTIQGYYYISCFNSVLSSDAMRPYVEIELSQHWLRYRLVAWRHQAIT